jgi:putative inorganic carbon (HCO3(-)) transporter
MRRRRGNDYEPVKRSRALGAAGNFALADSPLTSERPVTTDQRLPLERANATDTSVNHSELNGSSKTFLKRGHGSSFAMLWLFTLLLYARPGEFYPSALTASIALIVGLITLGLFVPTQLAFEGTLTASLPEVKIVLLLALAGLLSIPLALDPAQAWLSFNGTFDRCIVIFIVMVNVVRTEFRLKGLLFLALAAAMWLSVQAIDDYRLGLSTVEGYRATGRGDGIFGNTNDMALHMVTTLPIAIALLFNSRRFGLKLLYALCALFILIAIVLSYSRGAFIGLLVSLVFLGLKLGRNHRFGFALGILLAGAVFLMIAPGYGMRILSIFIPSLDPLGSADARRGELFRSLYVAVRHPFFGIGMGNYASQMSLRGLVTHNAYTQVASEMGFAALVCYVMFIVQPLRKLAQIARETFAAKNNPRFYYLTVGLQASLIAYLVSSFFLSIAYTWYVYYLVAYAVCLRRLYEAETGKLVLLESKESRKQKQAPIASGIGERDAVTI